MDNARRLRTAVIVGSTRPVRLAREVAEWVCAENCPDLELILIDLADLDLPLLNEPSPAAFGEYARESTRAWSGLVAGFDAFVLASPEYNHSTSAALKNALDHLYAEWRDKAVAFVGYGIDGGTRAVEHLRAITAELGMAGVGPQVSLSLVDDFAEGALAPRPHQLTARGRAL
jgi:NAD(P)H-dependent FMN reductase